MTPLLNYEDVNIATTTSNFPTSAYQLPTASITDADLWSSVGQIRVTFFPEKPIVVRFFVVFIFDATTIMR